MVNGREGQEGVVTLQNKETSGGARYILHCVNELMDIMHVKRIKLFTFNIVQFILSQSCLDKAVNIRKQLNEP